MTTDLDTFDSLFKENRCFAALEVSENAKSRINEYQREIGEPKGDERDEVVMLRQILNDKIRQHDFRLTLLNQATPQEHMFNRKRKLRSLIRKACSPSNLTPAPGINCSLAGILAATPNKAIRAFTIEEAKFYEQRWEEALGLRKELP